MMKKRKLMWKGCKYEKEMQKWRKIIRETVLKETQRDKIREINDEELETSGKQKWRYIYWEE